MKLYVFRSVLLLICVASLQLSAAEIKIIKGDVLGINGRIQKGDYDRLIETVVSYGKIPSTGVLISSSGGDVLEAIKIGRFVRKNHLHVFNIQPCDSACAFIVFSAVERLSGGDIGLHRPYYDPMYFAKLTGEEANNKYKELDKEVRNFLIEMNVPTIIIDKIMSISSSNIERMKVSEYEKIAGKFPPAHEEWLAARCGSFEENERQDYIYAMTLVSREEHPDVEIDPDSLIGVELQYRLDEALKLPSGYRNYIYKKGKKIVECEKNTIEGERLNNYQELKNQVNR